MHNKKSVQWFLNNVSKIISDNVLPRHANNTLTFKMSQEMLLQNYKTCFQQSLETYGKALKMNQSWTTHKQKLRVSKHGMQSRWQNTVYMG